MFDQENNRETMAGARTLGPGDHLGKYAIVRALGAGGMGQVWEALDGNGRAVALKLLPPEVRANPAALRQFRASFERCQALTHQHIGKTLDLGDDERWGPFLVMELIPGVNLRDHVATAYPDGRVPLADVVALLEPIAAALDYAHEKEFVVAGKPLVGVLHRDVKPENIMVRPREGKAPEVWLIDFGLAAEIKVTVSRPTPEKEDTIGTPHYQSPEQALGKRSRWDGRLDQYSLAVVAYELLGGSLPFETTGAALVYAIERNEPDPIDDLPEAVNAALLKGLAKKKEERFGSCREFVAALARGAHAPAEAKPPPPPDHPARPTPQQEPPTPPPSPQKDSHDDRLAALQTLVDAGDWSAVNVLLARQPGDSQAIDLDEVLRHGDRKVREQQEALRKREEELERRRAEAELARVKAEEAKRKAAEEERRKAEALAKKRRAEEAKLRAGDTNIGKAIFTAGAQRSQRTEEEASRQAEELAKRVAAEELRRRAEASAKQRAEQEAKRKSDELAKQRADEDAKRRAAAELSKKLKALLDTYLRPDLSLGEHCVIALVIGAFAAIFVFAVVFLGVWIIEGIQYVAAQFKSGATPWEPMYKWRCGLGASLPTSLGVIIWWMVGVPRQLHDRRERIRRREREIKQLKQEFPQACAAMGGESTLADKAKLFRAIVKHGAAIGVDEQLIERCRKR